MKQIKFISLFLLAFLANLGESAFAKSRNSHLISPSQAKQMAEDQFGGRALSTTLVEAGDNSAYRVKLIKAGRVKIVTIPAKK